MFSLLDDFLGYNQVFIYELDRLKTTFRTKWGTFSYRHMPFGWMNVGATFQHAMDIVFIGLIEKSVRIYIDYVTMFSKNF